MIRTLQNILFAAKNELARPGRYYGDGGTIHDTGHIDVVTDDDGVVKQLWFRCQSLPFRVSDLWRGENVLEIQPDVSITGIELVDL